MPLKNNDFIEIDFIARIKDTNQIFDLTIESTAKKENIYNKNIIYKPIIICLGEHQIIKGLDSSLIGKEPKKDYHIEIKPEDGFGKKDPKLLRLIPSKIFKKQQIQPFPGLQVNIDGTIGTIRTISSGRAIVDFNHPLSGHTLIYEVKINRIIINDEEKVSSLLNFFIENPKIQIKDNILSIESEIPDPIKKLIEEKIKKLIPNIKEIKFTNTANKT